MGSICLTMNNNVSYTRLYIVLQSLIYVVILLLYTGLVNQWGKWYSPSIPLRQQTDAFLDCRLALSDNIYDLSHDYTWSGQGVQQVWGLGVPIWRLPFELGAKLFGYDVFPDRLSFGIFAVIVAYVLLNTLCKINNIEIRRNRTSNSKSCFPMDIFIVFCAFLLFPPFISLLKTRGYVWEEIISYGYLFTVLQFSLLIRFACCPTKCAMYILCALSGFGGFIRPTLLFYGVSTLIITIWLWSFNSKSMNLNGSCFAIARNAIYNKIFIGRMINAIVGMGIFFFFITVLWWTNIMRFGNGMEFGHALNVQSNDQIATLFATKFNYPFQSITLYESIKEMFGALFLAGNNFSDSNYQSNIFSWQSGVMRWREMYFRTYDLSYFLILLLSLGMPVLKYLIYRPKCKSNIFTNSNAINKYSLIASTWIIIPLLSLLIFYSKTPVISSRYLIDLGAIFATALVSSWWMLTEGSQRIVRLIFIYIAMALWFLIQHCILESKYPFPHSYDLKEMTDMNVPMHINGSTEYLRRTTINADDEPVGIPFDRLGWPTKRDFYISEFGELKPLSIIFANDIEYIELELKSIFHPSIIANPNDVRVKCGLEELKIISMRKTNSIWTLRFSKPVNKHWRTGLQTLFIASVHDKYITSETTPWIMKSIKWND